MIRIRTDEGQERDLTYQEFIEQIRLGRVHADTPVLSDVLTSGVWKPAIELQFFRSWAPKGSYLPREESPAAPIPESPGTATNEALAPPPAAEASRPAEVVDSIPWERMERIGFWRALRGTVSLAFGDASGMAAGIRTSSAVMPALVFGLMIAAITAAAEAFYGVALLRLMKGALIEARQSMPEMFEETWPQSGREILYSNGLLIFFYPGMIVLWSAAVHLLLRVFGKPERGFTGTLRAANYAMAPQILALLPFCGRIVGAIWSIVLTVRLLGGVHRMSGGIALLAVLVPLLGIGFWAGFVYVQAMMQLLPSTGGTM